MKRSLTILFGCTWVALVAGRLLGADVDSEKEQLQGTWKIVSFEGTGLAKNSKSVTLVFKGDNVEATIDSQYCRYELKLDTDKNPKQIDLIPMAGKRKLISQVDKGLYSVDGDDLTLCVGGQRRPVNFELRPETNGVLMKLKRQRD